MSILSGVARQAKAIITYQGTDISVQVFPQLVEISFCDRISFMEDTIEIELADPDHRFQTTWTFARAQPLNVTLEQDSWNAPGEIIQQPCGEMEIDKIHMEGPPSRIVIKGKSVPVSGSLKFQQKTRGWEKVSLKDVASEIASESNLTSDYEATLNPTFSRLDQREQSDMAFLAKQCKHNGLALSVKDKKLIIFDEKDLESKPAVFTIVCPTRFAPGGINNGGILKWNLEADSNEVVDEATSSYRNIETGETIEQKFTPPKSATDSVSGAKDIDSSRLDIESGDTDQGD